jgi:hypothetical protein
MLLFMVLGAASVQAQVLIGSNLNSEAEPHPGAVLDLQSSKGLLLPNVWLVNTADFELADAENATSAVGMLVYNINNATTGGRGKGLYVWSGSEWTFAGISSPVAVPVTIIAVRVDGGNTSVVSGSPLQFLYDLLPSNATNQNVVWSIDQGGTGSGAITPSGLFTGVNPGTVTVRATATDGSGVYGIKQVTVDPSAYLVTSITISAAGGAAEVNSNGKLQLTATIQPENATNKSVLWSIIAGDAADVNPNTGEVTGLYGGDVTVQCAAQDGSEVTQTYSLTVIQTTGAGPHVTGNSGKSYATYCYPNGLGCWTANIAEAGQSQTTYTGKTEGERGYYYLSANASAACDKVAGYAIPTSTQWNALKAYLNAGATPAADKAFFFSEIAMAGHYVPTSKAWAAWGTSGDWWAKAANKNFGTYGLTLAGPDTQSSIAFTVRCFTPN